MHTDSLNTVFFFSEKVPIGESCFMNHMFWGRIGGWDFFLIHRTFNGNSYKYPKRNKIPYKFLSRYINIQRLH